MSRRTGGKIAALLVRFYQCFLSFLKPPCCRFHPTCSEYSRQAFLKFGFFGGLLLTLWRLLRCQPFYHGAYYDPVPDEFPFPNRKNKKESPSTGAAPREKNNLL